MLTESIKSTLHEALPDATVHVQSPDDTHFMAIVISPGFDGMPLVRQHQAVMRPLKEDLKERVHALQLYTFTPAQWETRRGEFGL